MSLNTKLVGIKGCFFGGFFFPEILLLGSKGAWLEFQVRTEEKVLSKLFK